MPVLAPVTEATDGNSAPKLHRFFGGLFIEVLRWCARHRLKLIAGAVVTLGIAFILSRFEPPLLHRIQIEDPAATEFAYQVSHWGELLYSNGFLLVALLIAGYMVKSARLRRAAVLSLLVALVAGILVNIPRASLGRARPHAGVEDKFYWFEFTDSKYQGFPSAHTTVCFATAGALIITVPVVGIPYTGWAAMVGWSRMQANRHYPSDVFVGALLGIAFGLAFGQSQRRLEARYAQGVVTPE